ncbi:MAG: undecaprenyldiphospho-muramoylpentapeptide beta-N-acetylglucosaminyltransferase [Spirochaetaceae bacterium]|nr:undecaprenyldiphospho-muramoylpentapeptide beta-N-acetylglucosaminyltransferase [Spirochaetaceae bacterium]
MPLAVFTGGGTAGHIIPGLAVIDELRRHGWQAAWIGSRLPSERELVGAAGVPFHAIPAGKLRRYLSLRNVSDLVLVAAGCARALLLLAVLRPAVVFAKGSYVSVPPVIAARLLGIPVITHESDATPALATRINATMARTVLVAFDATRALLPPRVRGRVRVTGNPLRTGLELGDAARARARLAVPDGMPLLLVTGGSSGARAVNELIHGALPAVARHWFVVHQTGPAWQPPGGGVPPEAAGRYRAVTFVNEGFADLLAAADVVVSRAGANTLGELAATGTPAVLIPLPRTQSRGEQLANARLFAECGAAVAMLEEQASAAKLLAVLEELRTDPARRAAMGRAMAALADRAAARRIAAIVARTGGDGHAAGRSAAPGPGAGAE